jgi:uncharacterized Zn finger protein
MYNQWAPYVPVAERRRKAEAEMAKLKKKGHPVSPVVIQGRAIATTVWGKGWCQNLESYADFANRLERGRTYVRNGSVVDLQLSPGRVEARVSGSSMYRIEATVKPVPKARWQALCADCSGGIDSLVELLQGRFAGGVMERLCRKGDGLFPAPKEIELRCSCPDGAYLCKHLAAVLYGIGARLDERPELLFTLRQVDAGALIAKAGAGLSAAGATAPGERTLASDDLGALFGLELDAGPGEARATSPKVAPARQKSAKPGPRASPPATRSKGKASPAAVARRLLRTHGALDNGALRAATGLGPEEARRLLQELVTEGLARVEGQKRGTRYVAV